MWILIFLAVRLTGAKMVTEAVRPKTIQGGKIHNNNLLTIV
jgi:hypothetical protein